MLHGGGLLDKDSLYTLPIAEDMKILQSIVNQMDSNFSQDAEGTKGLEWQSATIQDIKRYCRFCQTSWLP